MTPFDLRSTKVTPVLNRQPVPLYERGGKRVFDVILALLLLPVLIPIIALLVIAVCVDGGSGFYGHARIGKEGRRFHCWKIRTMGRNADQVLTDHLRASPAAAEEWARTHKLTDDPRVTRLGRFLRRSSLDELPQIWNVLRGEMSFVGPRPVTLAELPRYGSAVTSYLNLRPGITGQWQIHGRSDGCYEERCRMDADYAAQVRWLRDLALILATVKVLVQPTGR
ncbi:MAG: sugar transferase [Pseudomonadota bacterium]